MIFSIARSVVDQSKPWKACAKPSMLPDGYTYSPSYSLLSNTIYLLTRVWEYGLDFPNISEMRFNN